jgi:hypothetical protein
LVVRASIQAIGFAGPSGIVAEPLGLQDKRHVEAAGGAGRFEQEAQFHCRSAFAGGRQQRLGCDHPIAAVEVASIS